jgi:hypothetical protein
LASSCEVTLDCRALHTSVRGNGTVDFSGERIPGTTKFFVNRPTRLPRWKNPLPAFELD